jgi:hypothetical protein
VKLHASPCIWLYFWKLLRQYLGHSGSRLDSTTLTTSTLSNPISSAKMWSEQFVTLLGVLVRRCRIQSRAQRCGPAQQPQASDGAAGSPHQSPCGVSSWHHGWLRGMTHGQCSQALPRLAARDLMQSRVFTVTGRCQHASCPTTSTLPPPTTTEQRRWSSPL